MKSVLQNWDAGEMSLVGITHLQTHATQPEMAAWQTKISLLRHEQFLSSEPECLSPHAVLAGVKQV